LNEKGIPTPLAAVMLRAPMSRMDILSTGEINSINRSSVLVQKYSQLIDRESAYEILNRKITMMDEASVREEERLKREKIKNQPISNYGRAKASSSRSSGYTKGRRRTTIHPVVKVLTSATFIRGVMGILKKVV
jgi:hypothetical protein